MITINTKIIFGNWQYLSITWKWKRK